MKNFIAVFFVGVLLFSARPVLAACGPGTCDPNNANACSPGQNCIDLDNDGCPRCESQGPGLTRPGCSISFSGTGAGNQVGNKISVNVSTWDNGQVYFKSQPVFSGACAAHVGFCPINANVCTKTNNAACSNVCPGLYFTPQLPGTCNVSATVSNDAGTTTCSSGPFQIVCPSNLTLSGNFSGNPVSTCVDVRNGGNLIGTYCGLRSWTSPKISSGPNYSITPRPISGYRVSPANRQTGATCTNLANLSFVYSKLPTASPTLTPTPTPTPFPPTVTPPIVTPPPPLPGEAYFQTSGGNVTANSGVVNGNLPDEKDLIETTSFATAGVPAGAYLNLGLGGISPKGWNLVPYASTDLFPSYEDFLGTVLRRGGVSKVSDLCGAAPGGVLSSIDGLTRFYCYRDSESMTEMLERAISDSEPQAQVRVVLPHESLNGNFGEGPREIKRSLSFSNANLRPVLLFVKGNEFGGLTISGDVVTKLENRKAAFLAIVKGKIEVSALAKETDGVMVFYDVFSDLGGTSPIVSDGSLLGKANSLSGGFLRDVDPDVGPAERWDYQGRYLDLFKNVLARPKFVWEEVSL